FDRNSFQWIDFNDRENTVISFFRKNSDSKSVILYIFNFTPVARHGYRIGIPQKGKYRSIFNSDSMDYGGSGYEFKGEVFSDETSMHGYPWSMEITLPPSSCLAYKFINEEIK
ncbi:alpha amylase C-terminal domain-containing protein, partial [Metallibacterium scheffleri]|uniref:alpha amylase C-terminal domain-containing protein n=1 Tax=Metallibacterium scheffleri TaxID=993689 RepID=UPI0023F3125D